MVAEPADTPQRLPPVNETQAAEIEGASQETASSKRNIGDQLSSLQRGQPSRSAGSPISPPSLSPLTIQQKSSLTQLRERVSPFKRKCPPMPVHTTPTKRSARLMQQQQTLLLVDDIVDEYESDKENQIAVHA
ncbi:hypothetical protein FBU59_006971 [Linderina macrospora]|uniref:Uncharacterized protein n=1 Tax=Linderina macrospora TaxID=4868 RepID=A0ACC1IYC4_9FUNG|nr:hypothetical protein FBU59_006971 [Linderina macrospora]